MNPLRVRLRHHPSHVTTALPDAAAVAARVCGLHRQGVTGRGVRVALIDTGIRRHAWFEDHAFRVIRDTAAEEGDHGTGLAAIVLSIAPDVSVEAFGIGDDPARAVRRATRSGCDLLLAAWGCPGAPPDLEIDAERCIAARASDVEWPASIAEVRAVTRQTSWPTGPFSCAALPGDLRGLSVATAVAVGVAALLVGAGVAPREATARAVRTGPASAHRLPPTQVNAC